MKRVLLKAGAAIFLLILGWTVYEYALLPEVSSLETEDPATTALMRLRDQEYLENGRRLPRQQIWVPYDTVSEHLKKAILIGEDAAFFFHKGVDLLELREALKEDWEKGKFKRGGSTITMQLARNLYLDPSKSPLRKLKEIAIAWKLERRLSKKRIFELYLNVVEWGSNIYGAEAAARYYFSKPAFALSPLEAATLTALLPNPRNPREKALLYRRNLILTRMAEIGYIGEEEFKHAKDEPLFEKEGGSPDLLLRPDKAVVSPAESRP